jgi:hypothetical protein
VGVGRDGATPAGVGGGVSKPPEIRLHAAISLRRPLPAAASHGHRVGHAALDDDIKVASLFFLCVRIFCGVAAASKPPAQPIGFVPGWDWGGAAVSRQAASVSSGLDRVCEVLFRVKCVIVRGHVVFSFFLLGLSVKLYPPLE